jgi:hypothetical protein
LSEVRYWAEQRVDRVDFVARILRELDKRGWPNRSDIGWSEFDLEIFGNRWSNVQLVTAAEDHPRGRQLVRCRLRARWSLRARALLWLLLAAEAIVVGYFGGWLWLLVAIGLTLPLATYFFSRQKRRLQSLLIVFLDELAKEMKLIKVTATTQPAPASPIMPTAKPKAAPMRVELPKPTDTVPATESKSPAV